MRALLGFAAGGYAALAFTGTALAVDRTEEAAFFGIRTGWPLVVDVAAGYGTALSAGWPIVLALLLAAQHGRLGGRAALTAVIGISVLCVLGQLAEPLVWELVTEPSVDPTALTVGVANVLTPLVMIAAAARLRVAP